MGNRQYLDPDLQAERRRPARLAYRRPATDHLRANQESRAIHDAAVELASALHARSHIAGGGDIFESETVLGPFGRQDLADDVDSVNQFHWKEGMPRNFLIFHTGIGGLSVLNVPAGDYASIQEHSYEVQQVFTPLADWYTRLVRPEYAERYGLDRK